MKHRDGLILLAGIISDQLIKFLIVKSDSFYRLNPGIVLGFLSDQYLLAMVFNLLGLILVVIFVGLRNQKNFKNRSNALATIFILTGGISNIIDRIIYGGVVDYIDFKI